jgi:hypothetical protein
VFVETPVQCVFDMTGGGWFRYAPCVVCECVQPPKRSTASSSRKDPPLSPATPPNDPPTSLSGQSFLLCTLSPLPPMFVGSIICLCPCHCQSQTLLLLGGKACEGPRPANWNWLDSGALLQHALALKEACLSQASERLKVNRP